ncbi:MAG: hypothetical protein EPO68_16970 [Planctomycetota bacterium]|nr:MAG: hypothetical protein EPO68_16970 [Planctomycetota bacterium]
MLAPARLAFVLALACAPLAAQVFQGSLTKPVAGEGFHVFDVATDGDWSFASQPHSGTALGTVRAYHRGPTGFALAQTIATSVPLTQSSMFGASIAASDGFLAVGAPGEFAGRVHVYRLVGGAWVPFQGFSMSFAQGSVFGDHVELVGQRMLVYYRGVGVGGVPRVQIRAFDGQTWKIEQTIEPPDFDTSVQFGRALSLDGDRLAIGDRKHPQGGRVHLYRRGAAGWTLEQTVVGPSNLYTGFGASVAWHGDRLLVGAPNNLEYYDNGRLFVYEQVGHAWTIAQQLFFVDPQLASYSKIHFGAPLDVSGDWIAVGQDTFIEKVDEASVHLFRREGNAYVPHAKLLGAAYGGVSGSSEQFGHVLSFEDGTLAVKSLSPVGPIQAVTFDTSQLDSTLQAWPPVVSLASGGAQSLVLDAGAAHAGDAYLMLGSVSGTAPGIPIGALTLPLNPDEYLTLLLQQAGPISPALGYFGQFGKAQAALSLPPGMSASLAGLVAHHAYVVLSPTGFDVELASTPVAVTLVP